MKVVVINGVKQTGYPTPRLVEAGGGLAYRKGDIWYLYVAGKYEADDGEYVEVTIITVPNL